MRFRIALPAIAAALALVIVSGASIQAYRNAHSPRMGRQPDGSFLVSSGQRIEGDGVAFPGRPSDIALHPFENVLAVLSKSEIFITTPKGPLARSHTPLGRDVSAGFHGLIWTPENGSDWWPDARRCVASTDQGYLQEFLYSDMQLDPSDKIVLNREGDKRNAWPGGMCLTRDGRTLFVAAAGLDAVVEVDLKTHKRVRDFPVQTLPYEVKLSADEKTLIVSNWGGRKPVAGDETAKSGDEDIVVDKRGAPSTGTVSMVNRETAAVTNVDVGIHPTSIVLSGDRAFVANAMSDSISELDISAKRVVRTIPIKWGKTRVIGAMPNALAIAGGTLYACDGGDNALCEIDIKSGAIRGFRHAGYWPCAIQLSRDGKTAYVLNSKGNGSVGNTQAGNPGSPHDFVGTLSVIDLTKDVAKETKVVAKDNHWSVDPAHNRPHLAVYNGAIKHVVYIIKENQTYDSIFGDLPEGNGDPSLCVIGEKIMPNHRALAKQFTLFDNGYVSGTNSADGHSWCTQSIANDYMEHFYISSRTYPDDGDCAMSISTGGCLWDSAAEKHKSIRVYGEFCDDDAAVYRPYKPKDWFEAWQDRESGGHKFRYEAHTLVAGLKPYVCPDVHYWPLIQSDQSRADIFIREYQQYSKTNTVPDLMIICLPCDHSEGLNPDYPTPRAMRADNDLALGRVIDTLTHSPQWKDTCVFVTEDDGQALPDHVDGHRVPYMVISPYTKLHTVDSNFYTGTSMLRSIELMLGINPMTKFDALANPITTCFNETPDLTPYAHVPNNIPLDERNPQPGKMSVEYRYWFNRTKNLDWGHIDGADPYWLSRATWYSLTGGRTPFPSTPGQAIVRR